ncbi:MAG: hypothetical protein JNK82_10055 [Myxococcaceae bacterium]|nr:hypothetical protein [Myxococcaceae bacterium]
MGIEDYRLSLTASRASEVHSIDPPSTDWTREVVARSSEVLAIFRAPYAVIEVTYCERQPHHLEIQFAVIQPAQALEALKRFVIWATASLGGTEVRLMESDQPAAIVVRPDDPQLFMRLERGVRAQKATWHSIAGPKELVGTTGDALATLR